MENTKTRREAAGLVLVVFFLGVMLGGVGNHVWAERVWGHGNMNLGGHPSRNQVVNDLTQQLELSADQQTQLGTIIDDTRSRWNSLYAPLEPEHERIRQEGRARIRALLSSDQQKKFDAFMQHLDEERKKSESH